MTISVVRMASVAALLLWGHAAGARPLQDVVQETKPGVVHLGVLGDDGEESASGSGFVISRDGRIATNFHVIEGARRMRATFADGKEVEVTGVVAFDAENDVAILTLERPSGSVVPLSDSPPREGDEVIVIGSPKGLSGTISTGIVSALRQTGARLGSESFPSWTLQITAPISPGSSGSPVLNGDGSVIGLAVGVLNGQALNFAVPVAKLRALIAAPSTPSSLPVLREGRSVRTNLTISAAFLAGLAIVWSTLSRVFARKSRVTDPIDELTRPKPRAREPKAPR